MNFDDVVAVKEPVSVVGCSSADACNDPGLADLDDKA